MLRLSHPYTDFNWKFWKILTILIGNDELAHRGSLFFRMFTDALYLPVVVMAKNWFLKLRHNLHQLRLLALI